jgi:hypothetical protein
MSSADVTIDVSVQSAAKADAFHSGRKEIEASARARERIEHKGFNLR